MNKLSVAGLCVGGVLLCAGGAFAVQQSTPKAAEVVSVKAITAGMEQEYAEVLNVVEIKSADAPQFAEILETRTITKPGVDVEVCENVTITHQAPTQDENQVVGTAAGAVIGGVLGNQVGGGNGKKVATVAGAVVGGIIGKNVQASQQAKKTYQTVERQCRIEQGEEQITGYEITYRWDGATSVTSLSHKPSKLPVVKGQLVTDAKEIQRLLKTQYPSDYEVFYQYGNSLNTVVMPSAPKVGEQLFVHNGQVVIDPQQIREIKASHNDVVAYQVTYRLGSELKQARMAQKPTSQTLMVKRGKIVEDGSDTVSL